MSLLNRANSLAMERMREMDENETRQRMNTKQKHGTPIRDISLQQLVLNWLIEISGDRPRGKTDFDHWIVDGTVLVKAMQYVVFNSVPMDLVLTDEGLNTREERIKMLKKYMRKFGVPEVFVFDDADLFEFRNIPKVTRCIAMLGKMANVPSFRDLSIEAPVCETYYYGDSDDDVQS